MSLSLWSQCRGDPYVPPAVVLANNHPPSIRSTSLPAGDVDTACEPTPLCVDVSDPDDHDLEVAFTHVAIERPDGTLHQVHHTDVAVFDRADLVGYDIVPVWRFCSAFTPTQSGRHEWRVRAFDLMAVGGGRMDDALRQAPRHLSDGSVIDSSRDERTIWAQVDCTAE